MSEFQVESWEVERLQPYENNAKVHNQEQIEKIAESIKKFGWDQPIVVDGAGVIIKGHGRWMAAKHLGKKYVPVVVRTDLSRNDANAARLADNRVAVGDIDTEKLQRELSALKADDFDMESMGFSEKELSFLTTDLGILNEEAIADALDDETIPSTVVDTGAGDESEMVSISKVLGFTKMPKTYAPAITAMMNEIQAQFESDDPAKALFLHAQSSVTDE